MRCLFVEPLPGLEPAIRGYLIFQGFKYVTLIATYYVFSLNPNYKPC